MARLHKLSFNNLLSIWKKRRTSIHYTITLCLVEHFRKSLGLAYWTIGHTNRKLIFHSELETTIYILEFHVDPKNNELNDNPVSLGHEV